MTKVIGRPAAMGLVKFANTLKYGFASRASDSGSFAKDNMRTDG